MALKTVIIGGSNTVMQPGYWPTLQARMARLGAPLDIVADLAVGGTTSAFGLFQLKGFDGLAECDLLLIEYALNDAFVYGDERRPNRHWARFYEGIIRHALEINPRLKIVSMVFGSRGGSYLASVPAIDSGIHYMSDWYGASVINVSRTLMLRYGREVVNDPAFYSDQGHYARPIATSIVADIIADELTDLLAVETRPRAMPLPIDPQHFAGARIMDANALVKSCGLSERPYKNRRFSVSTADLGELSLKLEFEKGRPLAFAYVCDAAISPLEIAMPGQTYEAALLKGGVRDGAFKFLVSMLSCDFLYPGPSLLQEPPRLSCSVSVASGAADIARHVPKDNVAHEPGEDATPLMPLLGMLYTGTLKSCTAERRTAVQAVAAAVERAPVPSI